MCVPERCALIQQHGASLCVRMSAPLFHTDAPWLPALWSGEETVAGQRRAGEREQPGWLSLGEWGPTTMLSGSRVGRSFTKTCPRAVPLQVCPVRPPETLNYNPG